MAAVTVKRRRINYVGARKVIMATIQVPASGSTFATGLHVIDFWVASTPDADAVGGTVANGVVTILTTDNDLSVIFKAEGY